MLDRKGFTLIELVVTMSIFVIVIMLSSFVFEKAIGQASRRSKTIEGQLEGVVGLEILRTDLDSAGYGLPFKIMSSAKGTKISGYSEAIDSPNFPVSGINRATLNDAPLSPPRGVVGVNGGYGIGFNRSDYLVIKSVTVALNDTAKKSSRVMYDKIGADPVGKIVMGGTADDLQPGERAIVMRSEFEGGVEKKRELLIDEANGAFYITIPTTFLPTAFSPHASDETCLIYGIDPSNATSSLRMPFNRADYYINRPANIPQSCNASTGVLYKVTSNHSNGGITYYPLVDCIGDMQVVYLLDMDEDGNAGTYSDISVSAGSQISSLGDPEKIGGINPVSASDVVTTLNDAELLRIRLKEIQVYILAQMGKKDNAYRYPDDSIVVGVAGLGRTWTASEMAATFGAEWRNYRWKVYKITSNARNMQ